MDETGGAEGMDPDRHERPYMYVLLGPEGRLGFRQQLRIRDPFWLRSRYVYRSIFAFIATPWAFLGVPLPVPTVDGPFECVRIFAGTLIVDIEELPTSRGFDLFSATLLKIVVLPFRASVPNLAHQAVCRPAGYWAARAHAIVGDQ